MPFSASEHHLVRNYETAQNIYLPRKTSDYVIKKGRKGLGLYATGNISKDGAIFQNSLQYTLTDVEDGDHVMFYSASNLSIQKTRIAHNVVPPRIQLNSDIIFTHGIPVYSEDRSGESSGIISQHVHIPSMLMNHSCEPNTIYDSGNDLFIALRDIEEGEELTCSYSLIYYDEGPVNHRCLCGTKKCNGEIMGFKYLKPEEQERLLPDATKAVRSMFMADMGVVDPVTYQQPLVAERFSQAPLYSVKKSIRMVWPNPSSSFANVAVRKTGDDNSYSLLATRDFREGEKVYSFWSELWPVDPVDGKVAVEMAFPLAKTESDPVEGNTLWLDPLECGKKNSDDKFMFSGFDLLTKHSCSPNLVYDKKKHEEKFNWQAAFAARDICRGEELTVNFNALLWDRTGIKIPTCSCKSEICSGTSKGFRYLSVIKQKKLWLDGERHFSPLVREHCKRYDSYHDTESKDYEEGSIHDPSLSLDIDCSESTAQSVESWQSLYTEESDPLPPTENGSRLV